MMLSIDDKEIGRQRGKGRNIYTLDGRVFTAFGNEVPPEIRDLLNLQEINFQGQHDSSYWFAESAGEVSRRINKIVNLSIIDSVLSYLNMTLKRSRTEVDILRTRLENTRQRRDALKYVRRMDKQFQRVEMLEAEWKAIIKMASSLSDSIDKVHIYETVETESSRQLKEASGALKLGEEYLRIQARARALADTCSRIRTYRQVLSKEIPDLSPLNLLAARYSNLRQRRQELESAVKDIRTIEEQKCKTERTLQSQKNNLRKLVGNRCPLCNQPIPQ